MAKAQEYDLLFKMLLVGDSAVGKSSMVLRYADNVFTDAFISTIGVDFKMKTVPVLTDQGELVVKQQIWDTMGQSREQNVAPMYRGAHGIVVAFDVTDPISYQNVRQWLKDFARYAGNGTPKILVGTKNDLESERAVDFATAKDFADDLQIPYVECSSKWGIGVDDVFATLTQQIMKKQGIATQIPDAESLHEKMKTKLRTTLPLQARTRLDPSIPEDKAALRAIEKAAKMKDSKLKKLKDDALKTLLTKTTDILAERVYEKAQQHLNKVTKLEKVNEAQKEASLQSIFQDVGDFIKEHPEMKPDIKAQFRIQQGRCLEAQEKSTDALRYYEAATHISGTTPRLTQEAELRIQKIRKQEEQKRQGVAKLERLATLSRSAPPGVEQEVSSPFSAPRSGQAALPPSGSSSNPYGQPLEPVPSVSSSLSSLSYGGRSHVQAFSQPQLPTLPPRPLVSSSSSSSHNSPAIDEDDEVLRSVMEESRRLAELEERVRQSAVREEEAHIIAESHRIAEAEERVRQTTAPLEEQARHQPDFRSRVLPPVPSRTPSAVSSSSSSSSSSAGAPAPAAPAAPVFDEDAFEEFLEKKGVLESCQCPISGEVFKDPVFAMDGHTYERTAIQNWWNTGHNTSPKTREVIAATLIPNHDKRGIISNYKDEFLREPTQKQAGGQSWQAKASGQGQNQGQGRK